MSLRNFKVLEAVGRAEVLEETLSDGSQAYSVRFALHAEEVILDCIDRESAYRLSEALNESGAI